MTRKPPTLVEVAVRNLVEGGMSTMKATVAASRAVAVGWQLAYAAHERGSWPTQAEYAEFWKVDVRTAERDWARVKLAFGEDSPEPIARHLYVELGKRLDKRDASAAAALSVPAPLQYA